MKFSFISSSCLLLVVATPSALVVARKGKKTKKTKNKNSVNNIVPIVDPINNDNDSNSNLGPVLGGGPNFNCDPMNRSGDGCEDNDCASTDWEDGCEACMCYNMGNDSWCDGTKSSYYDSYYEEHGKNPFGDTNYSNRKCNTKFSEEGDFCRYDWECDGGLVECYTDWSDFIYETNVCVGTDGGGPNLDCDPMSSVDGKWDCEDEDCANDMWRDGCEACMCYNKDNASWCDGTKSAYYDNYFQEHGENPFGDSNYSNRKCNTNFSQQMVSCQWDWECESGLAGCFSSGCWSCEKKCCPETYYHGLYAQELCVMFTK